MEIGGQTIEENDQLDVSGDLKFVNGKVYLELGEGSALNPGESFTMVLSGRNSTTLAPDFISNFVYSSVFKDLEYVPIDGGRYAITGTLDANAIPEPSAWALLTLGVCGLLCWRKRKN